MNRKQSMDWIKSDLRVFKSHTPPCQIVHFDCVESPICPGTVFEDVSGKLRKCEDLLGSVLWQDAVRLFLPFLEQELLPVSTVLCLGEGTGAVGCALSTLNLFQNIYITDLPDLLPLLEVNARLAGPSVTARSLDWTQPLPAVLRKTCDVVIGCEVLYGNRFVWQSLLETIHNASKPNSILYLCITLRNARHDLEDIKNKYLCQVFRKIDEISLSDQVSVLRAFR